MIVTGFCFPRVYVHCRRLDTRTRERNMDRNSQIASVYEEVPER